MNRSRYLSIDQLFGLNVAFVEPVKNVPRGTSAFWINNVSRETLSICSITWNTFEERVILGQLFIPMRALSYLISFVFHPLVLFVYMIVALMLVNPYMFRYNNIAEAQDFFIWLCLMVIPIPLITVFMMKALGWAETLSLKKKEERVAPYLVTGLLYLIMYLQLVKINSAIALQVATLGGVITLFGAFFVNNFFKISLHAAGSGALVSMVILTLLFYSGETFILRWNELNLGEYQAISVLYAAILLTGIICTARLYLKEHNLTEIYSGLVLGFFAPLISFYFIA